MLLLDNSERLAIAEWQGAAARGVEKMPSLGQHVQQQRELFDAALTADHAPAKQVDAEQMELRRALGVA